MRKIILITDPRTNQRPSGWNLLIRFYKHKTPEGPVLIHKRPMSQTVIAQILYSET